MPSERFSHRTAIVTGANVDAETFARLVAA